jgi:hypothetical protein
MTTSINPVSHPHVTSQPNPAPKAQAPKPQQAQPAAPAQDKVTLKSAQDVDHDGDHG